MKKLRFIELWLLSQKEKKARVENLSDDAIAVVADNEYGKSSLVKALYATLGAEPGKTPDVWRFAQVISLLKFSIDGNVFNMLKSGSIYSLFDENGAMLWSVSGIVKGIGPQLNPMLDFQIELPIRNGDAVIPPPAFCFLPFYIDQDNSWNDTWESFSGLEMIPNYKNDIANFHAGIRPKEYYLAKAEKTAETRKKTEFLQERNALDRAVNRIKEKRNSFGIAFDPEVFSDRIELLLKEQNALQSAYDKVKSKVSELQSRRTVAFEEMEIARKILTELDADVKFVHDIAETEIVCPICNTVHKNDFANRYGLLNDAYACRAILEETKQRVAEFDKEIQKELRQVPKVESHIMRIASLLEETRGEVKLRDMLQDESERLVDETFLKEGASIDQDIGEIERKIEATDARMKEFDNAMRKKTILETYSTRMEQYCLRLGVTNVPPSLLKSIRPVINETGSSKPRLLLAYYYAILQTIEKHSTSCFCPIVVDTPLQQDQDPANAERMIQFAIDNRPKDSQLILATGSLHGVNWPGRVIAPSRKHSLLDEDQFETVLAHVLPFLNLAMNSTTP